MTCFRPERTRNKSRSSVRSLLALGCVSLALVLQSLAPPGYMAGSLDDGWPVVLCPEGLPAGFLGGHNHHHDDDSSAHDLSLDGHCPLGGMLDASTTSLVLAPAALPGSTAFNSSFSYTSPVRHRPLKAHPTRAPPAHA